MGTIGYPELIVIFLIVLLLFGGRKIPEIARGMGRGIREFRKARDDIRDAIENEVEPPLPVERKSKTPVAKDEDGGLSAKSGADQEDIDVEQLSAPAKG